MFTIVDPTTIPDWDDRLKDLPGVSFFHGSAWAEVLKKSYGYTPLYFVNADRKLNTVMPLMEVSSFITGKRAVSLPFTDYCELLTPHPEVSRVMFDAIRRDGNKRGWKYIELRGDGGFLKDGQAFVSYYRHTLDLKAGAGKLFSSLRDSNRRNIKQAEKAGIEIRFETSMEALREFYRLNCLTRRKHGLPPQPWTFFKGLGNMILARDKGTVALAYFRGAAIAANLYLHSNGEAIYKYGASDKSYQKIRANNLLMWAAVKRFADNGYVRLCFGRTELEHEGLRQFKAGWGTEEQILNYYRYSLDREAYVTAGRKVYPAVNRIFSVMPVPISKALGGLLYKHVG